MSYQRSGKECNEFMCGNSVEGVCREGLKDYKVITLCGSTKFKDEFMKVQKELTLNGYIVISVGCFGHSGDVFTDEQKIMLYDMHKRKIDMADGTFAGCFKTENGKIISLDGDSYSLNEKVIASEEWEDEEENINNGLTVIVEGNWI